MTTLRRAIGALFILTTLVLLGSTALAQGSCPTGPSYPPGYWQQERCIVTTVPGIPCPLVNICYCWHQGNGTPSDPDYYYLSSIEGTTPNCLDNVPAQTVIDACRQAILQTYIHEDEGGCSPPGATKYVVIKNSRCYKYVTIDDPMTHRHYWTPCDNTSTCTETYKIICPSTIVNVGGSTEGPSTCSEGCTQVTCP